MNEEEADRRAARLFRDHHGVIDRGRLLAAGITPRQMDRRLASGRWQQVHRGVYQLAGTPTTPQQGAARRLRGGRPLGRGLPRLRGLVVGDDPPSARPPGRRRTTDEEAAPGRRAPPPPQRSRGPADQLPQEHPDHRPPPDAGRPAAVTEPSLLADAVDHAMASGLVSAPALAAELQRQARSGRRGVRTLRGLLEDRGFLGGPAPSALEAEAAALLRRFAIPVEGREVWTGPDGRYRVDIMVTSSLVVEVDGYAYHWSPEAKRNDEARRNELRLSGLIVLVYTWRDIRFDQARVAREIRAARALHP